MVNLRNFSDGVLILNGLFAAQKWKLMFVLLFYCDLLEDLIRMALEYFLKMLL